LEGIYNAIAEARREKNKPTLIRLTTTIGYGSKQQGTHGVHGTRKYLIFLMSSSVRVFSIALKADDVAALKTKVGFDPTASFYVPNEVYATWAVVGERGSKLEAQWDSLFSSYAKAYPSEHAELARRISGKLPDNWEKSLPVYKSTDLAQASRKLSEIVLTAITPALPDLLGGSADLTGSNLTKVKATAEFQPENTGLGSYKGTYIRYGVREHGMGAIANGIAAYGGIIPFVGTFLNFVSYAAGAVRLAALSKHQVLWVGKYMFSRDVSSQ
jgi:transketolase